MSATLNLVAFDYVAPLVAASGTGVSATSAAGDATGGSASVSAAGATPRAGS
jgi:hypothetical protein